MKKLDNHSSSLIPMLIVGGLFFMFGFVTWLNGSLIPFLQIACELNHMEAYLVTLAFYVAYTVMALPVSVILRRTGFKNGMALGLFTMTAGTLVFIPAALLREYSIFLIGLFILGTGLTILQTASNPYIVLIGPRETAAVRISIMGVLNKAAGVVAPIVFTAFILADMSQFSEVRLASLDAAQRAIELSELSSRLLTPYLIMAGMLFVLGIFIKSSSLPEPQGEANVDEADESSILQNPRIILGAITLFFYVGAEVVAGDTIGLFGKGMGVSNFGQLTSYTMTFMVVGYLLGILVIPRWISQENSLVISASLGILFSFLLINSSVESSVVWNTLFGWTGVSVIPDPVLYVALFGLANAMVWPSIWPLALQGLSKKHTSTGSALMIMGLSGGAVFPLIYGALVESTHDAQASYWIMIPCYLFVLFYAVKGHNMTQWRAAPTVAASS